MTQRSRPQAGDISAPGCGTYVDSGPYAADRWATLFRVLFTGDQQAAQGVLKGVWNELAASNPAADRHIVIDTGVGVCNGHIFINDTSTVTIGVDAGVARSDMLVMLENNRNVPLPAGAPTNYNTAGPDTAIPPYSCRLAVVKNHPVNFSQITALFMTPLYTFTTGAAGFTNWVDARTFCQFPTSIGTRTFFVPCTGFMWTPMPDGTVLAYNATHGMPMPDALYSYAYGYFTVPADYDSAMTVQAVATTPAVAGNVRCRTTIGYGACSESVTAHTDGTVPGTETITATINNCIQSVSLALPSPGDIVSLEFERGGSHASDTLAAALYMRGWLVTYDATA